MELFVSLTGELEAIYSEELDLRALGSLRIVRASHVEPDADGRWHAQIVDGPTLGPFSKRSEAIAAEIAWIRLNRFPIGSSSRTS